MEVPPPLSAAPPISAATSTAPASLYPDSIESSPRSRNTDSWDAEPPLPAKLRLMCSYGGHIVPRPHDKSLCYIGGDTRIIVVDRHTTLSDLHHRLSKTLLHNQPFSLKYQLPNEDLDSLISVTTDEDLENMVEEYERLHNGVKPGRLRLFLFPKTSSGSVEQLLVETASTKSEDWFLNALNGKATALSGAVSDRGFSESSSVNCLLGLDDDYGGKFGAVGKDVVGQTDGSKHGGNGGRIGNGGIVANQDVHSVPDSPMLETTSSFGSTSSSPSMANLPPIRVHVEENSKVGVLGIEEQLQQMSVGAVGNVNPTVLPKQEEIGGFVAAAPIVSALPLMVGGDYANRAFSDDERSDHGGYRKVQQIQQPVQVQLQPQPIPQFQQKQPSTIDLPSPDSISSDGSVTNPLSRQRQTIYQEQNIQMQSGNSRVIQNPVDLKSIDQNNPKVQIQPQVQETGYVLQGQYEQTHPQLHQQEQYIPAGAQYIPAGAVPITSYYPMYTSQQQHHPHQTVVDQQYPVYFMPARQTQTYTMPVQQPSYSELGPTAPSSRPQTPPAAIAYNQARNAPSSKPERSAGVYRTAAAGTPQLVHVPSSQHQGQYVGFTQVHHPPQSLAPSSAANSSFAYQFADPSHAQVYYTQALPPQLAAQYQTLSSSPSVVMPDGSAQLPTDGAQQQSRASQT